MDDFVNRPRFFMPLGYVASGKSTVAEELAYKTGAGLISTDDIRKELFTESMDYTGILDEPSPAKIIEGWIESKDKDLIDFQHLLNPILELEDEAYRKIVNKYEHKIPEQKKVVYDTAFDRLDTYISEGSDVIFDATFSKKDMRQRAYETAVRNGLDKVYIIQVVCDADIVKKRLENRVDGKQSTTSNAKQLEIFDIIKKEFDSSHIESDNPLDLDISRIVYDTGTQEIMTYGFEDKTTEMIRTDVLNPLTEKYKN